MSKADPRHELGRQGEQAAEAWYAERGYATVERNWRCRSGEIDLIVTDGSALVFCEVKTRSTDRFGSGFDAVTADKQRRLRNLAREYLSSLRASDERAEAQLFADEPARRRSYDSVRFDVASVTPRGVSVLVAAF